MRHRCTLLLAEKSGTIPKIMIHRGKGPHPLGFELAPELGGSGLLVVEHIVHEDVGVAGHHGVHFMEIPSHAVEPVVPINVHQIACGALIDACRGMVGHELGQQHGAVPPVHLQRLLLLLLHAFPAKRQGASCRQAAVKGCHNPTPCWTRQIQARPNQPWARCCKDCCLKKGKPACLKFEEKYAAPMLLLLLCCNVGSSANVKT